MEGTANGNVLTFHWMTHDVSMAGTKRTTEGSGIVQYKIPPNGTAKGGRFEGTWGFEGHNADGGVLTGDRSPSRSNRFLRGDYQYSCSLQEESEGGPALSTDDVEDNPGEFEEEESEEEVDLPY
jgi:hypothetical protein